LNISTYADEIVLIGKNEVEIRQLFVETENISRKLGLHISNKNKIYEKWKGKEVEHKIK
jgi:hypothetical protein